VRYAGDAYNFIYEGGNERPVILIPPEGQALADGHLYQVAGRLFSLSGEFDISSAQLMEPLE
jgi:hypothetical protein